MLIDELIEKAFCDGYEYAQKEFGYIGGGIDTTYSYNQLKNMVKNGQARDLFHARAQVFNRFSKVPSPAIKERNAALIKGEVSLPVSKTPSTLGKALPPPSERKRLEAFLGQREQDLVKNTPAIRQTAAESRPNRIGFAAIRDSRAAQPVQRQAQRNIPTAKTTTNNGWTTTGTYRGGYSYNYTK